MGFELGSRNIMFIASTLGSDIPFFIKGGIQLCFGRGEILEKLDSNFEYGVILLKDPNVSVSTAETYKKYSNRFCAVSYTHLTLPTTSSV